jgi:hypothetical protein
MKSLLLSSICFGISVKRSSRYSLTFIEPALVVSIRLYMTALAFAPLTESILTQFLRPIVNGLMVRSAALLSSGTLPCLRNTRSDRLYYNGWEADCKSPK